MVLLFSHHSIPFVRLLYKFRPTDRILQEPRKNNWVCVNMPGKPHSIPWLIIICPIKLPFYGVSAIFKQTHVCSSRSAALPSRQKWKCLRPMKTCCRGPIIYCWLQRICCREAGKRRELEPSGAQWDSMRFDGDTIGYRSMCNVYTVCIYIYTYVYIYTFTCLLIYLFRYV